MISPSFFDNKVLLVTGGTGSFGRAVINRLVHSPIREIRIFSRDEKSKMICVSTLTPLSLSFI